MNWGERIQHLYDQLEDDPDFLAARFMTTVMNQVCRRMAERNMTQKAVAEALGTSQAYVAKVLNHHPNMKMRSFFALLRAVDLKLEGHRLVDRHTGAQFADTCQPISHRWRHSGESATALDSGSDTVLCVSATEESSDESVALAA